MSSLKPCSSTFSSNPSHVDGEWNRTKAQENVWTAIDGIGTARNMGSAFASGEALCRKTSLISKALAGAVVPGMQIAGGALIVGSALFHTIPSAIDEYKSAKQEQKDFPGSVHAKEALRVAKLGLANQYLYGAMGAGVAANGVMTLLSPSGAAVCRFHPLVSSSSAILTGGVLGGIYALRGPVVCARALYNLSYLNEFEKKFREQFKGENDLGKKVDRLIEFTQSYPKNGLIRRIGEVVLAPNPSLQEKIDYLEEVDKGLYTKKLQQKISLIIGVSMLAGGVAAIAMIFFSGLALSAITLGSSIAFTLMEGVYLCYDSSPIFEKLRKIGYQPSPEILSLKWEFEKESKNKKGFPLPLASRPIVSEKNQNVA